MKRYLAFWYEAYEALGGLWDAIGAFNSIEEAKKAVIEKREGLKFQQKMDSGYVFDLTDKTVKWALDDEDIDIDHLFLNEDKTQIESLSVEMGNRMFSFDHRTPEINKDILYLLGNGLTGVQNCQLVRGRYEPSFGDFSKDENGKHEYVTYWKYI